MQKVAGLSTGRKVLLGQRERLDSEGGSGEPLGGPKRRNPPADPKERLAREERDDLVLSPQRRSFGTGCHVPQPSAPPDGPSKDGDGLAHREPSRRIGSGRILRDQRDWDRENREYGYGGRRFEDTGHAGGHSGRYGGDRRRGRDERIEEEEEPEWFVGGPTSQHDTIELVGFDEDPEGGRRGSDTSQESSVATALSSLDTSKSDQGVSCMPLTSSPTLPDGLAAPALPSQDGFDLNEIFRADWCPQFLSEEPLEGPPTGGSRFSQWFRRDSPPPQGDQGGESRRPSSVHDDLMARVLASGSGEGGLRLPSPDSYFTPISPALPRDHGSDLHPLYGVHPARPSPPPHHSGQKNILDILLDANIDVEAHLLNGDAHKTAQLREHALSGKAKSVAELEADLKQVLGGGPGGPPQQHHHHHLQQPIPAVPERALQEEDLLRASYGHPAHNMAMHAVFGQHASPIPPAGTPNPMASGQSSNTLQVNTAGLRPRVPSPQELAVHTQSILQTALIKKILEEQKHKENLRKQQEAQRTRSPTLPQQGVGPNRGASPSKGLSPTMATFTPTSVMRKMHLEQRQDHPKGPGGPKTNGTEECDQQRLGNGTVVPGRASLGRAIIKGSNPMGGDPKGPQHKQFPQHPPQAPVLRSDVDMVAKLLEQQRLLGLQQQQQQQQQRGVPPPPGVLGLVRGPPPPVQAMKLAPMMRPPMAPQSTQGAPPVSAPRVGAPLKGTGPPIEMLQQALAHGLHPLTFQQLLLDVKSGPHGGPGRPAMAPGGGLSSATPANLAKWFGSDVLHQPTMPPVPHQKALLVEEVERQQQQATTVKN
ncbi:hypothetical protein IscW_ISCW009231 [Ixodes scapularis]|uniref:Eukaryotic translation initiation factor 4E transporter n=1 Tax=Ixodes scapularis TaxID=6945 RepID=B7PXU6_IXOSC|nr:hypothetical protein IscW_ISCW009231 [Ixodes scapularis]|eukprot:XP_002401878.1 hypothetical protein IscW_ISCW009231 [Ixodes scapularis]